MLSLLKIIAVDSERTFLLFAEFTFIDCMAGTTFVSKTLLWICENEHDWPLCTGKHTLLPFPPPHLLLLQHVGLAEDLHSVHVTCVLLLHQTHLGTKMCQ